MILTPSPWPRHPDSVTPWLWPSDHLSSPHWPLGLLRWIDVLGPWTRQSIIRITWRRSSAERRVNRRWLWWWWADRCGHRKWWRGCGVLTTQEVEVARRKNSRSRIVGYGWGRSQHQTRRNQWTQAENTQTHVNTHNHTVTRKWRNECGAIVQRLKCD